MSSKEHIHTTSCAMPQRKNNTRRRRLFVILLYMVPTFCSDVSKKRNGVHTFPADLASVCPYTSFCKENATQTFQSTVNEEPCCQPCSCESTCGLHYNCCYKHLDLFNIEEKYQMVCKSTTVTRTSSEEQNTHNHYRMINKCISTRESSKVKDQPETDTSTFHPVYSKQTGFIYFSAAVAVCNNAKNTVSFRKTFTCSSQDDFLSHVDRFLQGLEPFFGCFLQYFPPDGVNLKSERCTPNVVRKCNVTGMMNERTPYWDFCGTFNATYTAQYRSRNFGYGNIYCYECNKYWIDRESRPDMCQTRFDISKLPGQKSLTVILEPGIQSRDGNTNSYTRKSSGCPVNEIIVNSFSISCRPVKCPVLKVLFNNECKFYTRRLIGGPFVIYLRLVPVLENAKIPRSFFDNMPVKDKNDKAAKWLKRKTMKRWKGYTFFHLSPDNVNIDFFVLKATYLVTSVNPKYIEETVDMTLKELWLIEQGNKSIALRVHLNEYTAYGLVRKQTLIEERGIHVNEDQAYLPERLFVNAVSVKTIRDELLHLIPEFTSKQLRHSQMILITKLFFCKQIDLLPDEYENGAHGIFFKVRNVTLQTFIKVYTTEKKTHLDNVTAERETIRICLSEFSQTANVANEVSTFEVNIIAQFATIKVLIGMVR